MSETQPWITLAHLLRPQGRKGELLAELFTDFPEHFTTRQVFIQTSKAEPRAVQIESQWLPVGRNAGRIVLKLANIDSINDAETLAGADIVIPASERLPLEEGAAYISDLIDCEVFDHGLLIGHVEDVEFPTASDGVARLDEAAPILTVRATHGGEILIPFVHAYLKNLDVAAKRIDMDLPEGLLELNLSVSSKDSSKSPTK